MRRSYRKLKLRKNKNFMRNTIIVMVVLTIGFTTAYSAFSTNITLNAKGNIKTYTVTFDANGGNVDIKSKRVKSGSNYGDLPIPIREGYIFKGWHGKNMLNVANKESEQNGLHYLVTDETIHIYGENTKKDVAYGLFGYETLYNELEQNKIYTFSSYGIFNNNIYAQINYWVKNTNYQAAITSVNPTRENSTFTIPENYDRFAQIFIGIKNTAEIVDETFKLQLEEGDKSTKWEPYYITSDTEVVQENDHTLTAIWEETF